MTRTHKAIDWSYPTSPNAVKFKFKNGCYSVVLLAPCGRPFPKTVAAFATYAEAKAHADTLAQPYHFTTMAEPK